MATSPLAKLPASSKHKNTAGIFLSCCWQLCRNIHQPRRRKSPHLPLFESLQMHNWLGEEILLGIHLDWNYEKRMLDLSMSKYVTKACHQFSHKIPTRPQNFPHPWTAPQYGKKRQMVSNPIITPLTLAQCKEVQQLVKVFCHYAAAINTTMLTSISSISNNMTTATTKYLTFCMKKFLYYATTYPNVKIRYVASNMNLWVHSGASYLSNPKSYSRAGGYFYLSKTPNWHFLPVAP